MDHTLVDIWVIDDNLGIPLRRGPMTVHGRFCRKTPQNSSGLRRCMSEGLVEGEGFAVDASVVKADANRARGVPGEEVIDWRKGDGLTRSREALIAAQRSLPLNMAE
ncbi:hypothetical protein [Paraburkholderia kururiensis]